MAKRKTFGDRLRQELSKFLKHASNNGYELMRADEYQQDEERKDYRYLTCDEMHDLIQDFIRTRETT